MEVPSIVETQANLEEIFDKNQLIPVLRKQFKELTDDPFQLDVIVQAYLHKQADVPTMVGLFSPKWGTPQEVAQLLIETIEADLVDFDMVNRKFVTKFDITDDVKEALDMYQYPLPMIIPPRVLTNNTMGSGYIRQKGKVVLNGSSIFDDADLCLDHLNRCNSVKLKLDLDVVSSPEGKKLTPNKKLHESHEDYMKRVKQAHTFYDTSMDVMQALLTLGNEFWLTHKYDRRGRTYALGYHVNSQGTDYNKAVLQLAQERILS